MGACVTAGRWSYNWSLVTAVLHTITLAHAHLGLIKTWLISPPFTHISILIYINTPSTSIVVQVSFLHETYLVSSTDCPHRHCFLFIVTKTSNIDTILDSTEDKITLKIQQNPLMRILDFKNLYISSMDTHAYF